MREYPPLAPDHPLVGTGVCPWCENAFQAGDVTTLLPLVPPADPEEADKWREGRPYTTEAVPMHALCARQLNAVEE